MGKTIVNGKELILVAVHLDGICDGDEKLFFKGFFKRIKKENKKVSFERDMVFFVRVYTLDGGGAKIYTVKGKSKGKIKDVTDDYWEDIKAILMPEKLLSFKQIKNNKKFETYSFSI